MGKCHCGKPAPWGWNECRDCERKRLDYDKAVKRENCGNGGKHNLVVEMFRGWVEGSGYSPKKKVYCKKPFCKFYEEFWLD